MSGSSKQANGSSKPSSSLGFSASLARVLPRSAPSTPQPATSAADNDSSPPKKADSPKDYFSFRRRSRVGSISLATDDKEKEKRRDRERAQERERPLSTSYGNNGSYLGSSFGNNNSPINRNNSVNTRKEKESKRDSIIMSFAKTKPKTRPDMGPNPVPATPTVTSPVSMMSDTSATTSTGGDNTRSHHFGLNHIGLGGKRNSLAATAPEFGFRRAATMPVTRARKGSISSLSFQMPSDPVLPQGQWKGQPGRIRDSSPPPQRFRTHVAFDSLPAGDATKNNTASVVLNAKHQGYHHTRRSRIFMVGFDEHAYSDYALEYMLANLVDDGDHVVCVRVVEKDVRSVESSYRHEAKALLNKVLKKNYSMSDAAISVTLEYAVGKLHNTFQRLIQIYQPGMLIVGTRGRSGGIQGLMGTRNSFSKYCLQYSPIPVVVVRPDEQRLKKKKKRELDPNRGSYARILAKSAGGKHEADSDATSSVFELESKLSKDEEAHKVAQAIGLPASFDPTIKPLDLEKYLTYTPHKAAPSPMEPEFTTLAPPGVQPQVQVVAVNEPSDGEEGSGDEEDDEDEVEAEAEALEAGLPAAHVTKQQKEKLHEMEVGEAAALLKHEDRGDDDEDSEEVDREREGRKEKGGG